MIIFLNGASSSGKSTIAKHLQALLDDMYLHIGIDTFIGLMPEKSNKLNKADGYAKGFYWQPIEINNQSVYKIVKGDYGTKINDVYRATVAYLASYGLNIIVDDVCDGNNEMKIWREVLKDYDCLFIGVYCHDDELAHREKSRGDRKIGTAIEQSARVHQGIEYDLSIDTSVNSSEQCAKIIQKLI